MLKEATLHSSGDLIVYVDKALGVAAADWNGLSDPYVIGRLCL